MENKLILTRPFQMIDLENSDFYKSFNDHKLNLRQTMSEDQIEELDITYDEFKLLKRTQTEINLFKNLKVASKSKPEKAWKPLEWRFLALKKLLLALEQLLAQLLQCESDSSILKHEGDQNRTSQRNLFLKACLPAKQFLELQESAHAKQAYESKC